MSRPAALSASDQASLVEVRDLFAAAGEPTTDMLVGRHQARFVGPAWWRHLAVGLVAALGMPGWAGKEFWPTADPEVLDGRNLLLRRGTLVPSFPMRARVAPSRFDGRPALVVTYPVPAPWQWRQVTDELRPLTPGSLVGLTISSLPVMPGGLPFRLDRAPAATPPAAALRPQATSATPSVSQLHGLGPRP